MATMFERIKVMFGTEPQKPADFTPEAKEWHSMKRMNKADFEALKEHARLHQLVTNKWRNRRWAVLLISNLLFTFSFWLDIQMLEGALTASRFVGFHLIDLNSALQVMLAHKHIIVNLFIGTATVFFLWVLLGGRSFCSWFAPTICWLNGLMAAPETRREKTGHRSRVPSRRTHCLLGDLLAVGGC
jgi:ferredoxin-type protein NapH